MKLVSIIIPTYNRAHLISRTIDSCLRQDYSQIEILVVDDHSIDQTAQVVQGYKDPRVKYFLHENNLGVAAARNTGLRNALGEFVAFLDSDDEWMPEKISRQLEVFKNHPGIGLVFTNGYNECAGKDFLAKYSSSAIVYNPKKDKFFPLRLSITPPSSWMLPKNVMNEVGYLEEKMRNNYDDGDYFVRVASKYPIYFLNENLVTWHACEKHLNVVSANQIKNREYFFQKHQDFIKQDSEYLFRFYKVLGKDSMSIDRIKSRKYLWKAFLMKPYHFSIISKLIRC
jgi:O-antigen biosynthesis protein